MKSKFSEAARILGSMTSAKKKISSAKNGKLAWSKKKRKVLLLKSNDSKLVVDK
jgi:hypothetical protein